MTTTTETTIVETIINQLGGLGRLTSMINGHHFTNSNEGRTLTFKFKGSRKFNCVEITLNQMDTYNVRFIKIGRPTLKSPNPIKKEKTFENTYGESLIELFESTTELHLHF